MSADPLRRVDRGGASAEELLHEARIDDQAEKEALAGLLAAAAAPVRDSELSGEQSALAAFREAHVLRKAGADAAPSALAGAVRGAAPGAAPGGVPSAVPGTAPDEVSGGEPGGVMGDQPTAEPVQDRACRVLPLRGLPGFRIRLVRSTALGLATAAAGGAAFAFAAGTGHLPSALGGERAARAEPTASAPQVPGPQSSASGSSSAPDVLGSGPDAIGGGQPGTQGRHPDNESGWPSPRSSLEGPGAQDEDSSLRRLCREYLRDRDTTLNRKQRARLAEAAGGREKIREFCVRITARSPGNDPDGRRDGDFWPGDRDTGSGSGWPSGGGEDWRGSQDAPTEGGQDSRSRIGNEQGEG